MQACLQKKFRTQQQIIMPVRPLDILHIPASEYFLNQLAVTRFAFIIFPQSYIYHNGFEKPQPLTTLIMYAVVFWVISTTKLHVS